jgi:endonuclease/exonuclease/phosphatase family metal-dependent hydrolase
MVAGAALLPVPAHAAAPATLRVTTWNLQPNASVGATGWSPSFQQSLIQEAATTLAALKPDVVLLQQVADRESCDRLAQALLPQEYHVAVCSSFRDAGTGALSRQQVAILAKSRPYLGWPVSWTNGGGTTALPGGFAFAAIRVAGHNAGFYSVQFGDGLPMKTEEARHQREESARQLLRQIAAVENWTANRPESFLVGGDFNTTPDDPLLRGEQTLPSLDAQRFASAFAGLASDQRVTLPANSRRPAATVDYIFTKGGRQTGRPLITRTALAEHCAVTCDLDFSPPPVATVELSPTNQAVAMVTTSPNSGNGRVSGFAEVLAGCLAVIAVVALWAIRSRRLRQLPANRLRDKAPVSALSRSVPGVLSPAERQGVVAEISRWARQKVAQKLISDRNELLATQQTAALKVLKMDQRLSELERQIQKRRTEYEQRIDELLKELSTAREENRELIEARIALLKEQMEQDRLKTEHKWQ